MMMQPSLSGLFAKDKRMGAAGVFLLLELVVLVVAQGGYYGFVVSACGIVSWLIYLAVLAKRHREEKEFKRLPFSVQLTLAERHKDDALARRIPVVVLLFLGLALCYLIGALVTGPRLTSLSEMGTWFAVAGAAALGSTLTVSQRNRLFDGVCVLGAVYCVVALLAYFGVFAIQGAVRAGRLELCFEYANAAGAFLLVISLSMLLSKSKVLKALVVLPLVCLVLTQSGGSLVVLTMLCIALAAVAAFRWYSQRDRKLSTRAFGILIVVAAVAVFIAVIALAYAIAPDRCSQAFSHLVKRGMLFRDGLTLLSSNWLFGAGPDLWQYLYPYVQSCNYHVNVVHCSYLQVALDSGVVGLVCMVAAIVLGVRCSLPCRLSGILHGSENLTQVRFLIPLLALLIHALVDFDFQFGALALLLALLLASPHDNMRLAVPRSTQVVASLLSMAMCLVGAAAFLPGYLMKAEAVLKENDQVVALYQQVPLARYDIACQEVYLESLVRLGNTHLAKEFYREQTVVTAEQSRCLYALLVKAGQRDEAEDMLITTLKKQPYNRLAFRYAHWIVQDFGISAKGAKRFNKQIRDFNKRISADSIKNLPGQSKLHFKIKKGGIKATESQG